MVAELPMAFYSQFPAQAAEARRVGREEWSSPCPFCGGKDRFRMFLANSKSGDRYWCRVCGKKGFVNSKQFTPEQIAEYKAKRQVEREREKLLRQERVRQLAESEYWRGYHDAMRDVARAEWRKRGLPDEAQDWFEFGYAQHNGYPALSIPYHNTEWAVETVQYRLLGVDGQGKYRFESGYPAVPFWTRPITEGWPVVVAEGAIKAAVVFWRLVVEGNGLYNVVAVTGKTPGKSEIERLANDIGQRDVLLMLDPDATTDEKMRIGSHFECVRYVSLPGKVDDMLLESTINTSDLTEIFFRQARYDG